MSIDKYIVDKRFETYFDGRLRQVFVYITDQCQLRCEHCLYKTTLSNKQMDYGQTIRLLELFKNYGAEKLTLLGGEPTLWGMKNNYDQLKNLLSFAKKIGYKFIRVDTNGQFEKTFLNSISSSLVDDIAFSLDGHNSEVNDRLRGPGTFNKSIDNILLSIKKKFYTTITTCVHPRNIKYLEKMIQLANDLGANQINFHPMFEMGIERDKFTGNTHIDRNTWLKSYSEIRNIITKKKYDIEIRVSQRFVDKEEYKANQKKYCYCPQKMGERILIHPNGELRICALTIGSKYHLAMYDSEQIVWNDKTSEINDNNNEFICNVQKDIFEDYFPLCISFKPYQNEFVWKKEKFDLKFSNQNE